MTLRSLESKVVVVTGAGSGLGKAVAATFAGVGAAVGCLDVRESAAQDTVSMIADAGGSALAVGCDIADDGECELAVETVVDRFGGLDVLVNNAAIDYTLSIENMTIQQWDRVIGVNLRAPFVLSKLALPYMRQGGGHIVNIASTAATRAWANAAAYHASKWGLVGFSRALGVEGRANGVRVTTVIPGGMQTHFFDRFADEGIPMPDEANLQDPYNVAEVILCAVRLPASSSLQEVIVTPMTETSWP
jgi:NAD(P)-dependent dehydrogenase (short-subunit alcohol dehydrogenase family)